MKRVRVGVIGLGSWGQCHMEAYASLPQVEIVAICDPNEEHLRTVGDLYHINHRYPSHESLLCRDDIDLVSVVTFESAHFAPVVAALQSGKHVLVEKPVSTKVTEAHEMLQVAKAQGKFLMPGHLLRFDPRYVSVFQSLRDGRLGDAASVYLRRSRVKTLFTTYQRTHTVYELTVHDLDLAIWYTDSRVKRVRAYGRSVLEGAVPDLIWVCLEFANGALAVLESDWLTPPESGIDNPDSLQVIGTQGVAHFNMADMAPQVWSQAGRYTPDLNIHSTIAGNTIGALRDQLNYICNCLALDRKPDYVSFADAIHTIEVAQAVLESIETGRDVNL